MKNLISEHKLAKTLKLTAWIFILLIFSRAELCAAPIVVIVNSSGPLVKVADAEIIDIYLGEKKFEGEIKILPFLYPEGEIKTAFLSDIVKMTPKEYKLYWIKKVFQEGTQIPRTPINADDLVRMVRENKGGIGFLRKDMLKNLSGIKIIKVIGR